MSANTSSATEAFQVDEKNVNAQAIAELVPIALLIIIANGLVLVLFARKPQLRTPPNYVLFSLAVCDFMTGVINIPLFIIVVFTPIVTSSAVQFYLVTLVSLLHNVTAISTCYHILVATAEKYLSIIHPVTHRKIGRRTVVTVLKVVWVVSVIIAFIPFAWVIIEDNVYRDKLSLGHVAFCLVAVFLLPYSFMIYAFVVMFKSISSQGKTLSKSHFGRQGALEKRCFVLFVTMATAFLICWLPWFILMLLYRVCNNVNELEIASHVFVLVRYSTCIINPVLYTFFRRDFKTAALTSVIRNRRSRFSWQLTFRASEHNDLAASLTEKTAENVV